MLSGLYRLSGWTVLIYMMFPVVRILFGVLPLAHLTAPSFLLHFAPSFLVALSTAELAGAGSYTFTALALATASFWLFIVASVLTLARRRGSFKVTPRTAANAREPRAVWPTLLAVAVLAVVAVWGLAHSQNSATFNYAAFALFHSCILMTGCWTAPRRPQPTGAGTGSERAPVELSVG